MEPIPFGRFSLLHRIARGGMAELYLARTEGMAGISRLLVIKVVSGRFSEDPAFTTMFEDEVRIASTLSHPNIGQVIDVGQVGGAYFLAMEHIHGQDLRAILKRCLRLGHSVPVGIAVQVGSKVCSALQHAHEARGLDGKPLGIIHRDVSPSNVMVSFDGQVKLIDFGIAKAENRLTMTMPGTIKGKLRYLSPEQVLGQGIDARSDLFTLGVSLWEATVGQHLFDGEQEVQIYEAIVKGKVRPPSELAPGFPPGFERVLLKALATSPADRFGNAREMQVALEQFASEAQIPLSDLELSRFMREVFAEEIAAWEEAQQSGGGLIEYFRKLAPDDGSRPAILPEEGSGRSDSAIAGAGLVPKPTVADADSAPRKTILYGELQAPIVLPPPVSAKRPLAPTATVPERPSMRPPTGPPLRPPTGPATPILVTKEGLRTGPLPQLESDPGGRRPTVIVDDARLPEDDGRPTIVALPSALPQPTPAPAPQLVISPGLQATSSAVDGMTSGARPTIISDSPLQAIVASPTVDDLRLTAAPGVAPAGPAAPSTATGPLPMPIPAPIPIVPRPDPASAPEPVIGRDRLDLEEKKRRANAPEPSERPLAKTGDWAHQHTGEVKPGTHPYFHEEVVPPPAAAAAGRRSRIGLIFALIVIVVVGGGVIAYLLLGRAETPALRPDAGPPAKRRVELQSDPAGATIRDTRASKVLGRTPLALELSPGESLSIEITLAGHQRQLLVLQADTGRRKVYLVPELKPDAASTAKPDAAGVAPAPKEDPKAPKAEPKAPKAEPKATKAEPKAPKEDPKATKAEPKATRATQRPEAKPKAARPKKSKVPGAQEQHAEKPAAKKPRGTGDILDPFQ